MQRDPHAAVADAQAAARHARAVMEMPGLTAAFGAVEAHFLQKIRGSDPASGQDEREAGYHGLHALDAVRGALESAIAGAAVTTHNHRSSLNSNGRS